MVAIKVRRDLPVPLGRVGENKARKFMFPIDDVLRDYPDASFLLLNKRAGDIDSYPVAQEEYTVSGNYLNWIPTSADLSKQGNGKCELVATDNGVVCKDIIYDTVVEEALDGNGEAPDPWKSWQEQVKEDADRAEAAAELLEILTQKRRRWILMNRRLLHIPTAYSRSESREARMERMAYHRRLTWMTFPVDIQ